MPNQYGFSTNAELRVQFAEEAKRVFVAAYERDFQYKLPDWLVGKKLGHLVLYVTLDHNCEEISGLGDKIIVQEKIEARAALSGFLLRAQTEAESNGYRSDTEITFAEAELKDHLVMKFGEVALSDEFAIGSIPPDLVLADYTALTKSGVYNRHASATKKKPSKQSLVSGIYFAKDSVTDYINTLHFDRTINQKLFESVINNTPVNGYSHIWKIALVPDLHINGTESKEFLQKYYEAMTKQIEQKHTLLEYYKKHVVTQSAQVEQLEHEIRNLESIRQRTMTLLTNKG